jgi:hypothetical protein
MSIGDMLGRRVQGDILDAIRHLIVWYKLLTTISTNFVFHQILLFNCCKSYFDNVPSVWSRGLKKHFDIPRDLQLHYTLAARVRPQVYAQIPNRINVHCCWSWGAP